ncbi:MAG: L-aspartate oxidase [Anaerolineae bacterium]|jgi:L-aspartate oxidase|nr:L-aspartate oxidase [Anaerolineae bacterium]MBT7988385.1 L-aspartate oxidase [Anaerolineae bacterium]
MQTNTLIIGSGIAGATAALCLSEDKERQITLITRAKKAINTNSQYAQGGIVGRGDDDAPNILQEDILNAGDGICYPPAVKTLADEGPDLLREILIEQIGISFDEKESGGLEYGLEAAHTKRRILHVGDMTGKAIMVALLREIARRLNITILTGHTAVDLITFPHHARDPLATYQPQICHGAYVYDRAQRKVIRILANQTILASGGLGQIFLNTTNPGGARGDGLAMAHRAGVRIANAEYVQFHPTAMHMPGATKFLISEAVRGEGGVLLTPNGEPFMERHSPKWKDLASRDIVARAIYWEMLENDYPYVLLDIASHKKADAIKNRFPQIYERCLKMEIDITERPIPVVPAAHYFCGGVLVDEWGQSSIPGLYAVGEVSCTGVHGANRLASTSLLEGLVWGDRSARHIRGLEPAPLVDESAVPTWDISNALYDTDPTLIQGDMQTIRNLMWHYVGLVRSHYRLNRALRELHHLRREIEGFYRKSRLTDGLIGLRNSVQAALIVADAARKNTLSRGCHYREENLSN